MSKIKLEDLKPGTKYRLSVKVNTFSDTIENYPSFEFEVPKAPTAAKKNDLSISVTQEDEAVKVDRTVVDAAAVWYRPRGGLLREIKVISTTYHDLVVGDIVTISNTGSANYNATSVSVSKVYKDRNSFEYTDDGMTTIASSDTWVKTGTTATIVEKNGSQKIKKIDVANIKIPDIVINNLLWNDTVRDFVHVVYRSAVDKEDISGDKIYVTGGETLTGTPKSLDLDLYPNGMPKIVTKRINDTKYYEFQYIIARYIKVSGTWTGYWLEPGRNKNRLSNPAKLGS